MRVWFLAPAWLCSGGMHSATAGRGLYDLATGPQRSSAGPCPIAKEETPVKASSPRPIAARWQIGSALLFFAVAGQAFGQISGTVTGPLPAGTMFSDLKAVVVATNNDTNEVFTANPSDTDGTYSIDPVTNGTYKVVAVAAGLTAPAVTSLVISDASPT